VGLGPNPGPQNLLNTRASIFTKFIGVVGLGFNLTGSVEVVGLGRVLDCFVCMFTCLVEFG